MSKLYNGVKTPLFSFNTVTLGNFTYGHINGGTFLKVFYHDVRSGLFKDANEAKFHLDPNKYSILSSISNEHRDKTGKFTFALIYPEYPQKYNIWRQQNNPLNEIKIRNDNAYMYNVTGYDIIKIKADSSGIDCKWGGLITSTANNCIVDGCPGGAGWWYSIGYYKLNPAHSNSPAFYSTHVNIVSLWVQVTENGDIFYKSACDSIYLGRFNLMIIIFIFLLD